jgi:BirA family transcriptional regulator, biotin operon repressor / biotin---[acetyl-CoA-carboxylase] ligase
MKITNSIIKLLNILSDNQFHSGAKLAAEFNITRSAIWKNIQQLAKLGLTIESVTGKGYRLKNHIEFYNRI